MSALLPTSFRTCGRSASRSSCSWSSWACSSAFCASAASLSCDNSEDVCAVNIGLCLAAQPAARSAATQRPFPKHPQLSSPCPTLLPHPPCRSACRTPAPAHLQQPLQLLLQRSICRQLLLQARPARGGHAGRQDRIAAAGHAAATNQAAQQRSSAACSMAFQQAGRQAGRQAGQRAHLAEHGKVEDGGQVTAQARPLRLVQVLRGGPSAATSERAGEPSSSHQ